MESFDVICVDNFGIEEYYSEGGRYTVTAVNGDALWLVRANTVNDFWLMASRFKRVDTP